MPTALVEDVAGRLGLPEVEAGLIADKVRALAKALEVPGVMVNVEEQSGKNGQSVREGGSSAEACAPLCREDPGEAGAS